MSDHLFHIVMSPHDQSDYVHVWLEGWVCGARCPPGLSTAGFPDSSCQTTAGTGRSGYKSDRLAPLGANVWYDGDTEGNTESVWLTEGEEPKDKIWGCDDLAEHL